MLAAKFEFAIFYCDSELVVKKALAVQAEVNRPVCHCNCTQGTNNLAPAIQADQASQCANGTALKEETW